MSLSSFPSLQNSLHFSFFADPDLLEFLQVSYHSTFQSSWRMSGDSTKAHGFPEIMSDLVTQLLCHWDREANFSVFQNSYWISPWVFFPPLLSYEWLCGFCCSWFNIIKTLWSPGFGLTWPVSKNVCSRSLGLKYPGTGTKKFHPSPTSASFGNGPRRLNLLTEWLVPLPPDSKPVVDHGMDSFLHVLEPWWLGLLIEIPVIFLGSQWSLPD